MLSDQLGGNVRRASRVEMRTKNFLSISRPYIATIIVGTTRLIASMIAPIVVERAGRRILLLVSTAFCALSLVRLLPWYPFDI